MFQLPLLYFRIGLNNQYMVKLSILKVKMPVKLIMCMHIVLEQLTQQDQLFFYNMEEDLIVWLLLN